MKDNFQNEEWAIIYDPVYKGKRVEEHGFYRELIKEASGSKVL